MGMPQEEPPQDAHEGEPLQIQLMRQMVELSAERSRMAKQRNEMSEQRTYMNMERTLSVWLRTALAAMVVGVAIDRFGLFVTQQPGHSMATDTASLSIGVGMVALGVLIAVTTATRFRLYVAAYRRDHVVPHHHGPFLAAAFSGLTALFGVVLLVLLLIAPR